MFVCVAGSELVPQMVENFMASRAVQFFPHGVST